MIIRAKKTVVLTPEGKRADKVQYESAYSLKKARECLAGYNEHYTHKFRDVSSASLVFGRAIHDTFEDVMVEKYHTGYLFSSERAQQIFQWRWIMEYTNAREDGLVWSGKLSPEQFQQKGLALVDLWMTEYAPVYTPVDIPEPPFWITLSGTTRALYGRLDFPVRERGGGLIDYKTSTSRWDDQQPEWQDEIRWQMKLYHAGWFSIYKTWPAWVELHRLIIGGPRWIEVVPMLYTAEQVQEFIDTDVRPLVKKIEEAYAKNEWPCTCGHHESRTDSPADNNGPGIGVLDPTPQRQDADSPTA